MSRVDTSIGFSLRSEPPLIAAALCQDRTHDLSLWWRAVLIKKAQLFGSIMLGVHVGNIPFNLSRNRYEGIGDFVKQQALWVLVMACFGTISYFFYLERYKRLLQRMHESGFDSPVVHLTAEGQWVTFRFAAGREFVDSWDRLLRFKSAPEFTEFEFPDNPPIIIPTMAIPVETLRTISQFCAAEKIPSETKR